MEKRECKYCGSVMKRINLPEDSDFNVEYLLVCFNDDCEYYVRGWEWMRKNFNVLASYRYKIDVFHNIEGPLPVNSPYSFREMIQNGSVL
jgi:hypothetical protein